VLLQEHIFPFKEQVQAIVADMSAPSFLWPHSDVSRDHDSASTSVAHYLVSLQPQGSVAGTKSLQISDSFSFDLPLLPQTCSTDGPLHDHIETVPSTSFVSKPSSETQ